LSNIELSLFLSTRGGIVKYKRKEPFVKRYDEEFQKDAVEMMIKRSVKE